MRNTKAHRETLRQKGQFWTPDWLADAMLSYVLERDKQTVFDPAVGAGAFLLAAKRRAISQNWSVHLAGREIDQKVLLEATEAGLTPSDIANVKLSDFLLNPPSQKFEAIVANPPYIRHHRLSVEMKAYLRRLALDYLGFTLDGRSGLHNYFLLVALHCLAPEGKLAFIMPADTCESISSKRFWSWIVSRYQLDAVITFDKDASPFSKVDINPLIFLIRNKLPQKRFFWVQCMSQNIALQTWITNRFETLHSDLKIYQRTISDAVEIGLSRNPTQSERQDSVPFKEFFTVKRGVATGANDFFFLTLDQIRTLDLPENYFRLAVGRTRDIEGSVLDEQTIHSLHSKGRPSWLLQLDGKPIDSFPDTLQEYLHFGESLKIHQRPLITQRSPWYKMEIRHPPPFLFAYLGRRNARFIRNLVQAIPLTSFLCVYPKPNLSQETIEKLWRVLQHPQVLSGLSLVGKSYGGGAIKVEPRSLELLPIPTKVLDAVGLHPTHQIPLF